MIKVSKGKVIIVNYEYDEEVDGLDNGVHLTLNMPYITAI